MTERPSPAHHLTLAGELDAANAPALRAQLAGSGPVMLDLTEVSFVDSTILDVLARAATTRLVTIMGAQRTVRRVLEVSGLDQVLVVEDD